MLSFFPLDVLDEIWDVIESVSEGFLTYFCPLTVYLASFQATEWHIEANIMNDNVIVIICDWCTIFTLCTVAHQCGKFHVIPKYSTEKVLHAKNRTVFRASKCVA